MKTVELRLDILADGDFTMLLSDGDFEEWVGKLLIKNYDPDWEKGQTVDAEIPVWLAERVGWV